ncbi:MAG: MOSC domain-containing protein [Planctomycetes bacterium]|nr:MOSC domain-containing protein [Planctomycetota bacterium]
MAHVESIHLASQPGEATKVVDEVNAEPGYGLAGDRVGNRARAKSRTVAPHQQVTLIETEALEALRRDCDIELAPGDSRRNICTRDVALNHLVGREFRVGAATLRGIELCEPCSGLERMSGKPGVREALIHRGGLRAQVVTEGLIRRGDTIEVGAATRE